jgi:hypothetical protein
MALMVVVVLTVKVVHTGELALGMLPSVVQWMTLPTVVSDSVNDCGAE